jgi:hypothetical protein
MATIAPTFDKEFKGLPEDYINPTEFKKLKGGATTVTTDIYDNDWEFFGELLNWGVSEDDECPSANCGAMEPDGPYEGGMEFVGFRIVRNYR